MAGPEVKTFAAADYAVVGAMLAVSLGIGFYQACTGGRQRTAEEFLMANRNMSPIPVAMSLVASFISAITFLGTPAENYLHGIMHHWYWLSSVFSSLATIVIFMPTFYRLGITSATEYLELRFNRPTRLLGTFSFCFYMFVYLGIVLYAPALALNAVTGLSLWGSVFAVGLVCTLYTAIGGMKAVLWTDVFQTVLMLVGFVAVIIQGAIRVGGLDKAWHIAAVGERMNMWEWSTDLSVRHTIWGIVIGGTCNWLSVFGVNQAQVQRYLTCGSLETATFAIGLATIGMIVVQVTPHVVGVVMYANYVGCDPKLKGVIGNYDQLMPYFIMDLFGSMPGLPGLLTSAVFSAALSTISSGLNALAAVAGEDIVKHFWPRITSNEATYAWASKGLALFFGVLTMISAVMASQMGEILQMSMNIFSMFGGPTLGLYCSGMIFPWVNSKGAIIGSLVGLIFSFWLGIGAQIYPYPRPDPPLSIADCPIENTTLYTVTELIDSTIAYDDTSTINTTIISEIPAASVYKLSYVWWGTLSWLLTMTVANMVSFITGPQDPKKLDPRLISPVVDTMYCYLPEKWKIPLRCRVGEEFRPDWKEDECEAMQVRRDHDRETFEVETNGEKISALGTHVYPSDEHTPL